MIQARRGFGKDLATANKSVPDIKPLGQGAYHCTPVNTPLPVRLDQLIDIKGVSANRRWRRVHGKAAFRHWTLTKIASPFAEWFHKPRFASPPRGYTVTIKPRSLHRWSSLSRPGKEIALRLDFIYPDKRSPDNGTPHQSRFLYDPPITVFVESIAYTPEGPGEDKKKDLHQSGTVADGKCAWAPIYTQLLRSN
ncbi:hypothetical protein TNCV_5013121 [Trichonephila clavipes]|nr:hypothetical protein TNCV_5013121 [Trichonephila clavipes]